MKAPSQMSRTAILVEGALMVGLAFALSAIPAIELPFGGSVTLFSTLPILMMSLRHGLGWGLGTAAVYSFAQMLQGMDSIFLCKTMGAMLLCALLDYVLAYTLLGLAGPIAARFRGRTLGIVVGVLFTGLLRLLCSFVSGMVLWYEWAPAGVPVWRYSLGYNAAWCLPDLALALVAVLALSRVKALCILPAAEANRA